MPKPTLTVTRKMKMTTTEQLAEQLKTLRLRRGLSQRTLAIKAGMQQSVICRIEQGRHNPTLRTVDKLAETLEVKPTLTLC
jgi:transcriptional regulator with XRE-family HTH domain